MRRIVKIEIDKSIKSRTLIFSEDWYEKANQIAAYFVFALGIYICGSVYFEKMTANDEFIKYISPIGIVFFIYCIYRKVVEKKLTIINTSFNTETSHKFLLKFAQSKSYEISRESKQCLIFNDNGYILSQTISMVLLICDNKIYFTILKQGFRMDPPVLFSHISLKKELENYFANIPIESNACL